MDALILSCGTGGGHNSAALAVKEALERRGVPVPPLILIATDYTCIPFFEEVDCDYCVIPSSKLTREYLRCGFRPQQLYPLGIPVRESFSAAESQRKARRAACRRRKPPSRARRSSTSRRSPAANRKITAFSQRTG